MGTYLAKPVLDKRVEEGSTSPTDSHRPLSWGVVDMQGWRKSMEDAHVAQVNVPIPSSGGGGSTNTTDTNGQDPARVFAVFDGHGGAEVSRFCQLYLIDVLTKQGGWGYGGKDVDVGRALVGSFHGLDRLLDSPSNREEINRLRTVSPAPIIEQKKTTQPTADVNATTKIEFQDEKKIDGRQNASNVIVGQITMVGDDVSKNGEDDSADSDEAVGEIGEDRMDLQNEGRVEEDLSDGNVNLTSEDTISLFKRFLSISQKPKTDVSLLDKDDDNGNTDQGDEDKQEAQTDSNDEGVIVPTRVINGRQVCNLPDHPIHAGCASICAVIIGSTLTVANAGDCRAVLCRKDGVTEAMSYDHKPQNEGEKNRIHGAGGFVNQFGRVNGNLNLSRSIGDLKYKQVKGLEMSAQMITAEPDIKQVTLDPEDEFLVIGCDGIWDCLTNEEAVKYVRERIDSKTPVEIGTEMLDEIISDDPRETGGIGGDNMTVMIIDLLPGRRARNQAAVGASAKTGDSGTNDATE